MVSHDISVVIIISDVITVPSGVGRIWEGGGGGVPQGIPTHSARKGVLGEL